MQLYQKFLLIMALFASGSASTVHSDLLSNLIHSDVKVLKGGGSLAPRARQRCIQLKRQSVTFVLNKADYRVNATYDLYNPGPLIEETIGLPRWVVTNTSDRLDFKEYGGSVNGKSFDFIPLYDVAESKKLFSSFSFAETIELYNRWAKFAKPPRSPIDKLKEEWRWLTSRIIFSGNSSTKINVKYRSAYVPPTGHLRKIAYLTGTASLWKGELEKLIFRFDCADIGGPHNLSVSFKNCVKLTEKERQISKKEFLKRADSFDRLALEEMNANKYRTISDEVEYTKKVAYNDGIVSYEITEYEPGTRSFIEVTIKLRGPPKKVNYVINKPKQPVELAQPVKMPVLEK